MAPIFAPVRYENSKDFPFTNCEFAIGEIVTDRRSVYRPFLADYLDLVIVGIQNILGDFPCVSTIVLCTLYDILTGPNPRAPELDIDQVPLFQRVPGNQVASAGFPFLSTVGSFD
jgi:hypothetical protein|tara:strand:- start:591 stop:935 length:345 start_codon:yes stop_codon:yes gene_type:complete